MKGSKVMECFYKIEKQQYEENLQRCQEDHLDEMEIISLH